VIAPLSLGSQGRILPTAILLGTQGRVDASDIVLPPVRTPSGAGGGGGGRIDVRIDRSYPPEFGLIQQRIQEDEELIAIIVMAVTRGLL
jgi:hypothetical protein